MTKLVQRWQYYGWLDIVRQGGQGRETMFSFASVSKAYKRFLAGEEPPPLPSEQRSKARRSAQLSGPQELPVSVGR
jgi:phage terminase Nu1 subunit (DNA packaging protein)